MDRNELSVNIELLQSHDISIGLRTLYILTGDRLGGVVVERSPRVLKVSGLIPDWVIPNTFKIVVQAAILSAHGAGLALRLTSWCQGKWAHSTGNLPRNRRYITAEMLKAA